MSSKTTTIEIGGMITKLVQPKWPKQGISRQRLARYTVGDRVERLDVEDTTVHTIISVSSTDIAGSGFPLQFVELDGHPGHSISTHRICSAER